MKRSLIITCCLILAVSMAVWRSFHKEDEQKNSLRFVSLAWQESAIATNRSIVEEWNRQHPEMPVEYIQGTWDSAHDYLVTAFETGDVPDIFHYESGIIVDYAMRGYLTDLSPYIPGEMKRDVLDVAWATVTRPNGEVSGIPFLIESLVVLYNKSLFEKAGIVPPTSEQPWTWDDLRAAAKRLTIDEDNDGIPEQYGAGFGLRNSANIIMNTSVSFGGSYFKKENGQYVVTVRDEEKELLQHIVSMLYIDRSASPSSVGQTGTGMIPGFISGRYAMLIGIGAWARQQVLENGKGALRWGVLPLVKARTTYYGASTQTLSVPKKSRHPKEAMMFINFMLSSKNTARLAMNDWMIPARTSCLAMPEFKDSLGGWDVTCAMVPSLHVGSWLGAPGYVEWKSRIANPVLQELFAGRMSVDDAAQRIERESNVVLSRYKRYGNTW